MTKLDMVSQHDFLYYELKETRQKLEYWENEASYKTRGAKVRVTNLKSKLSDLQENFHKIGHKLGYSS